jgi:TetR/AcrR family transcriptional regulator
VAVPGDAPPVAAAPRRLRESSLRTREIILDAALREFADKGFDGARVDQIALLTGLNKNVLYHHFASKDGLFASVLERTYAVIRASQNDISLRGMDPVAATRKLVISTGRIWIRYPEFQRLLYSENLHRGRHVSQSESIRQRYNPLLDTLRELLARGQATGVFRAELDPVDLYISITSLTAHYMNNRFTFEAIFQTDLMAPRRVRQRLEHAAEMVLSYMMVQPISAQAPAPQPDSPTARRAGKHARAGTRTLPGRRGRRAPYPEGRAAPARRRRAACRSCPGR